MKKDVLDIIRNSDVDSIYPCDTYIREDNIYYSKAFDVPYYEVIQNRNDDEWAIIYPRELRNYVVMKSHVENYIDPYVITLDDSLFEL